MASAIKQSQGFGARRADDAGTSVPVILDRGMSVEVAAIPLEGEPRVGTRFEHGGTVWEIVRAKDYTRGWVARPVRTSVRCASH